MSRWVPLRFVLPRVDAPAEAAPAGTVPVPEFDFITLFYDRARNVYRFGRAEFDAEVWAQLIPADRLEFLFTLYCKGMGNDPH